MNRRAFLVQSSLATAAGLVLPSRLAAAEAAPRPPLPTPPPPAPATFVPLRRNVGYFTARGGTIGWLSNSTALMAVDTQYPETAAQFFLGLPGRGDRNLDIVLNTHHHGDHTGGNSFLKPRTRHIVAHANAPKLQLAAAERAGNAAQQVYADTTFTEIWRRDLGDETVISQYHGVGHTSGDVVTLFEKANVIHMGDLMFNRIYPVIDRVSGGSIRRWISLLEEVHKTYPADAQYIYGHGLAKFGPTGTRADLLVFRDYLTGLLDYVQKKITAGESKEKIVALENMPGFEDFHTPLPNRFGGNLSTAYDELTAK
jgi:cyclase